MHVTTKSEKCTLTIALRFVGARRSGSRRKQKPPAGPSQNPVHFAHAAVMAVMAFQKPDERGGFLGGVAALAIIGVALIVLAPAKQSGERASAVGV